MPTMSAEEELDMSAGRDQVGVKRTAPVKPSSSPAPAETRPRKPKSSTVTDHSSSSRTSSSYSKASRDRGDHLLGDSLGREFRGTSPSVLQNIERHCLILGSEYEPPKRSNLSAKSRKVLRNTADLAVLVPGLRSLLEVQYLFVVLVLSCGFA